MNIIKEQSDIEFMPYVHMVDDYYKEYGVTTEIHIDTLVVIYRITGSDIVFGRLFRFHYKLLNRLIYNTYHKYSVLLDNEDLEDLQSMAYFEFYRRIRYYMIPPEAPFSKYVKLYMRQWLNAYAKLMADKNKRRLDQSKHLCEYAEAYYYAYYRGNE